MGVMFRARIDIWGGIKTNCTPLFACRDIDNKSGIMNEIIERASGGVLIARKKRKQGLF